MRTSALRLLAAVAVSALTLIPTPAAQADANTTLLGIRAPGGTDHYSLNAMRWWQGDKYNAVAQFYGGSDLSGAGVNAIMTQLWNQFAVPSFSLGLVFKNTDIAAGLVDVQIDNVAQHVKIFLSGPDLVYGNADDRRAYMRPAWEMNGSWSAWSPCSGTNGTAADFRNMWRHLHSRYTRIGIDRTRLAWIFSANQSDTNSSVCSPEQLYPGDAYVDWTGIDGYSWDANHTPADVFDPMLNRLRALAPTKPVGINEVGVHTGVVGGKSPWITAYHDYIEARDIRMSLWFNIDKENDWAVFGGAGGDHTFNQGSTVYNGYSAYRTETFTARMIGSNRTNARLLTDSQFLGS